MKEKEKKINLPEINIESTIYERFQDVAIAYGDKIAVDYLNKSITYKEIKRKSDQLAYHLIHTLGKEAEQVAFFMETGIEQIISILGILKAGKTYVALDVNFPSERNIYMLEDSQSTALITNNLNASQAKAIVHDQILINIDQILEQNEIEEVKAECSPDTNMMIVYTSGSTGEPKGVVHTHRNILHFIKRFNKLIRISSDDNFSFYYSISFSAHAMQIMGSLLNGARLSLYNLQKENFSDFSSWLNKKEISVNLMIPTVLRQFMATLKKDEKINSLRVLLFGGETLYKSDVDKAWKHVRKSCDIYNIYASTEAYLCRAYKLRPNTIINSNIVPIGYSIEDFEIEIVGDDETRKDPNKIGEMQIKSEYIALRYWNKSELTSRDFAQDGQARIFQSNDLAYKQSDGCIVHIGRSDSMVKLRGYRIDLGEIENLMIQNTEVKDAAVVVKENQHGTKHIVAYIIPRASKQPDTNYLRIAVLRMLPSYMVPSYFVILDALPKNEIGKTIKKDLPDPEWDKHANGRDIVDPKNTVQEELKEIFERILEVPLISITDNIMELGADSLRLFVAFDEIEKKYGKKLNIDAIVDNPTIEFIGGLIEE